MKQNIYIAALLAGMLALAGCGGGGSAVCNPESDEFQCLGEDEYNRQGQANIEKDNLAMKATALETALTAAEAAGEAVTDVQITAITDAHTALATALDDATEADETAAQAAYDTAVLRLATVRANKNAGDANQNLAAEKDKRITAQKAELTSADNALSTALTNAETAGEKVTAEEVAEIKTAQADLMRALNLAVDVSDEDKAQYQRNHADSLLKLATVEANRKIAKVAEQAEEARKRASEATDRANAASLKAALDNVKLTGSGRPAGFDEDNETSDNVAALHGWTGARYEDKGTDGKVTSEGYLYTKLGEAETGKKFGTNGSDESYEYTLTAVTGIARFGLTIDSNNNLASRIMIDDFKRTAGYEEYKKKQDDDDDNDVIIIPGNYHGVPGDYRCTVADGGSCRADYSKKGQTFVIPSGGNGLGLVFVPDNPEALVTAKDADPVAEYGWWLDKSGNSGWTVNVFSQAVGQTLVALNNNADLPTSGTAKYVGGASGKYAFSSLLGDSHEAGHFTARVTLDATFDDAAPTIKGTVNGFEGDADGMDAWSVALGTSRIGDWDEDGVGGVDDGTTADNGFIAGKYANPGSTTADPLADLDSTTTWTIGSTAADASGDWQGQLWNLEKGVPTVATGTFTAEYGSDATMAGAFGADQE